MGIMHETLHLKMDANRSSHRKRQIIIKLFLFGTQKLFNKFVFFGAPKNFMKNSDEIVIEFFASWPKLFPFCWKFYAKFVNFFNLT